MLDHTQNIESVIEHQRFRFFELYNHLSFHSDVIAIIQGKDGIHSLGEPKRATWLSNDEFIAMKNGLTYYVEQLTTRFPHRVLFNELTDTLSLSFNKHYVYVCNANPMNWNNRHGSTLYGSCFEKQLTGVFGIVTTPVSDDFVPLILGPSRNPL
jgi:hypothetical protein